MTTYFGGVEAGGTNFVCAVGRGPEDLLDLVQFPTAPPDDTLERAITFFQDRQQRVRIGALGIGSFGPVDLREDSPTYGSITETPKPGWSGTDIRGRLGDALGLPVGFDTDVNAAALAEHRWGAAQGLRTFVYLTIGTGIGGGGMSNGRLMHGLSHPEMGHIRVPHDRSADPFEGVCPYHGDCLEGLAAGPAIESRWGQSPESLPADHPAWALEARYLALGVANILLTLSPERIVMGGGVMEKPGLIERVRENVVAVLNGYIPAPEITESIENYLVRPALGDQAGVLGALALAQDASAE